MARVLGCDQRGSVISLVYIIFEFVNVLNMYVVKVFIDKLVNKQTNL